MTKNEIHKLDKEWQIKVLERDKICRMCGTEPATAGHHIIPKSTCGFALRWWLKNGLGVGKCHDEIHRGNISLKPSDELQKRANLIVKNIKYQYVVDYLNGIIKDYI